MVIICVRDQDHIQMGHVLRHDRLLNHDVHIEPLHQRVEHHRRATAVDEEARVAEPTDNCLSDGLNAIASNGCVSGALA